MSLEEHSTKKKEKKEMNAEKKKRNPTAVCRGFLLTIGISRDPKHLILSGKSSSAKRTVC